MSKEFLGNQPIGKLLFKLSVPTITAQLVNMLYNVVDRIYIGHLDEAGDLALTGVGVCMPLIMLVSAFAALISSGGAPRASIFMGKGDYVSAEKTMSSCFIAQIFTSVILTLILFVWHEDLLLAFGASENTIRYAADYMKIYAIGTIFVELTLGLNAYITAQGASKVAMLTVVIGAATNIALDPIFIYALDMGVRGAALATVISQAISTAFVIVFLVSSHSVLRLKRSSLVFSGKLFFPAAALGTAPFIMQSSESVISICFNSSLLKYGGDIAVGAMTILTSVMQFAMLPLQGLAQGAQPILSYNYGARKKDRVVETFKLLLKMSLIYSVALWGAIMLFPELFASIFTPDKNLIAFTAWALRIYCACLGIFGVQIACQMTFVSLGKAGESVLVAIMRKFVLLIPLIFILPCALSNDTLAVYLAEPIADFLAVSFTAILFIFQFKKALSSIEISNNVNFSFHKTEKK